MACSSCPHLPQQPHLSTACEQTFQVLPCLHSFAQSVPLTILWLILADRIQKLPSLWGLILNYFFKLRHSNIKSNAQVLNWVSSGNCIPSNQYTEHNHCPKIPVCSFQVHSSLHQRQPLTCSLSLQISHLCITWEESIVYGLCFHVCLLSPSMNGDWSALLCL